MAHDRKRLGEILIERGVINHLQLRSALTRQEQWGKKLGETLVDMAILTEAKLAEILSEHFSVPFLDLTTIVVEPRAIALLKGDFCEAHTLLPLAVKQIKGKERLIIVTNDPSDLHLLDSVRFMSDFPVAVAVAKTSEIRQFIQKHYFPSRKEEDRKEITVSKLMPEEAHMDVFRAGKFDQVRDDAPFPPPLADASYPSADLRFRLLLEKLVRKLILTEGEAEAILNGLD